MNNFYIYRHIRLDTNAPFYIGKGVNNRASVVLGRNKYWTNIVNKYGFKSEIMIDNLTEEEALQKEQYFIKLYKDINLCEANITLGGEGVTGLQHSDKTKAKIAESMRGRYLGKIHTEQSKINMSRGSMGQKGSKGRTYNYDARKNMAISHGSREFNVYEAICIEKPIPRLRKSGVYNKGKKIGTFIIQKEAAKKLKVNQSDISLCLNDKVKQIKGYIFEYNE